jgi:HEAT repeat protein
VRIGRLNRVLLAAALCGAAVSHGMGQDGPAPDPSGVQIEDLRADDADVRRDAANKIRAADRGVQREALPAMIRVLMEEKDGQVRLAVLDAVTAMGADAAPAVPALLHTLRTDYGGQRLEETHQDYRSALAMAAIGRPAVEGLRGLLGERKEGVRAEAVMALGRIGPDAEPAIPDLTPLLGDRNERIRREAALALGRIGAAAVDPLIAATSHADAIVRERAVEGLGHLSSPDERARRAALQCASDAAAEVRAAALKSLAKYGLAEEDILPILKDNLRHEDERVRLAAVDLLVGRRTLLPLMAAECESLLMAEHDGVSRHAAFLLGRIGPDAAPRLLDGLRREGSRIDQIAEALAQIGRPVAGLLARAVGDPEPRVRRGAALALGQIRPLAPGAVERLAVGLGDPDLEVQASFLTAIGSLGPRAGDAVPSVRALLRSGSPDIRLRVIDVLSRSAPRDDHLFDDLASLLDDADARVQTRSIETLRSLGPPGRKALTVVIRKLESPDRGVQLAAAEFIGSHGQAAAEAVPALIPLLAAHDPERQTLAAQTLGTLGKASQPALDPLTSLLAAEPVKVREAAVLALGSLGLDAEPIRPHLARALRDKEPDVRRAAMSAIQRFGPQGSLFVPDIIALAEDKENLGSVQRSLRRFERRGPDVRSLPELVKQLDHDSEAVRLLAIKFLGLAGPNAKDAIASLERLREDPSAEVRKQAEAACERIKNGSPARDP